MSNRKTAFALAVLSLAVAAATQGSISHDVRGTIAPVPEIANFPGESYMVYLPRDYSRDRPWPILYVLDPRSRGQFGAELFQVAAEKYGYIIASSNNSHSDVSKDPNVPAMNAMWADTHARFSVDPKRTYVAGFSGTARFAFYLSRHVPPGTIAGIIAAGAGYPPDLSPNKNDRFVVYLTVGKRDFNFNEVMELEPMLRRSKIAHHLEVFDGVHQWPPERLRMEAIEWMELQAMKSGSRPRDPRLVKSLWQNRMLSAARAEQRGDKREARRIRDMAQVDFAVLYDVSNVN